MTKKSSLFQLIKSLSKSEKRYFRLQYAGKDFTNYLKLFGAIEKQDEYRESEIKDLFKNEKFSKQLHVTKIYLAELILKALKNFHSKNSVSIEIIELLKDIEVLFDRELYDLCLVKITKAENLAEQHEKFALLSEICNWKRKLLLSISYSNNNQVIELLKEENDVLQRMSEVNEFWQYTVNLFNYADNIEFLDKIKNRQELIRTFTAQKLYHHILYSFYFIGKDNDKAYREISALITFLEHNPDKIKEEPNSYIAALSNKLALLISYKRWQEAEELLIKIRATFTDYNIYGKNKTTVRLWLRLYNLELEMRRDEKNLVKGTDLLKEIKMYIKQHLKTVPPEYLLLFYYQFAYINYLKQNYKEALVNINEILNANFDNMRIDIQCYARILSLIIHYELNNIQVLKYSIDSTKRYLKKHRISGLFFKDILNFFMKLIKHDRINHKEIFHNALQNMFIESNHEIDDVLDYIELTDWMKTHSGSWESVE